MVVGGKEDVLRFRSGARWEVVVMAGRRVLAGGREDVRLPPGTIFRANAARLFPVPEENDLTWIPGFFPNHS
jgi:hypothetical protein